MAAIKLFVCVAFLAASLKDVRAISKDNAAELYQKILPHVQACTKELGLAEDTLKEVKEQKNADGIDPCFFSCVFKKASVMTDGGKFDADEALKQAREDLKEEKDIKIAENAIKDCEAVNSEDADECGRARSLIKCFMKHKTDYFSA